MTFASITVHTALTAPVEKRSRWTPTSSSWVSRRAGSNRLSLRCIQLKWDFRTTFVTKGCHTTPNKTPHVSAKAEEKSCPVKAFFYFKTKIKFKSYSFHVKTYTNNIFKNVNTLCYVLFGWNTTATSRVAAVQTTNKRRPVVPWSQSDMSGGDSLIFIGGVCFSNVSAVFSLWLSSRSQPSSVG